MAQLYEKEHTARPQQETTAIQIIEARCLGTPYRSRQHQAIDDVSGKIVGKSTIAPSIYIQDKISQMREAPALPLKQRYEWLRQAGKMYEQTTLAGLTPQAYITLVSAVTGLQQSVVYRSLSGIADSLCHMNDSLQAATPRGAVWEHIDPAVYTGCSLFSRRGDVLSIITAGNGPGVHGLWPQAIAMGYRTLVRPSFREPFTAQRLVCALEQAGLANYVALMPTDHKGAETLIAQSDLAIVYGGPNVAAKYSNNPQVLVQGPGRSKIVVGKDIDHEEAIPVVAQSVLSLGGAACVSASAVLVEDDHVAFASKLKNELAVRLQDQPHTLARQKEANAYEKLLQTDNVAWAYDQSCSDGFPLKPHVAVVDSANDPKAQRELPFPCITVAPFNPSQAYKALSHSLVVTVLSRQQHLIHKILNNTSIANVYIGHIPTTWMDFRVPHDGYLADFLMCNRGIRIEQQWLS